MELIKQPDRWSCNACAWAMALGLSLEETIDAVGHDGSEILFPNAIDPDNRAGFLDEQLTLVALQRGYAAMSVTPSLEKKYRFKVPGWFWSETEFREWMAKKTGVLEVTSWTRESMRHAVAWNGEQVYDPMFGLRSLYEYTIHEFIWIFPLPSTLKEGLHHGEETEIAHCQ